MAEEVTGNNGGALLKFLGKFDDWKFCPSSNHLWTVKINLHNDGTETNHSFAQLYNNILKVNEIYHTAYATSYKVGVKDDKYDRDLFEYIQTLQDNEIGMFLANEITFTPNSFNIQDNLSQINAPFSGWLSYGKIVSGRVHTHNGKISFYSTNWNINELLFDKWIAAIGEQGLIEGDTANGIYNIKGDMYISEYAAGAPLKSGYKNENWVLRKIIKLTKVFPRARDQYKYAYTEDASDIAVSKVDFEFENYSIEYEKANYLSRNGFDSVSFNKN